jgi:predicted dehydrogenase
MVIRVGVIGLSDGNGHPFSMSAIINGYSESGLAESGWPVIHEYIKRRHPSEFGIGELRVTHAWTQDPDLTRRLCNASLIENAVKQPQDLIGSVDAIILARDDYEKHREMATPFLDAGLPIFVDKPLTLSPSDLEFFRPYLERGQLMSGSAMRFATELDAVRAEIQSYGRIKLIRGAALNDWSRYGVHLLDAILPLLRGRPLAVIPHTASHESLAITTEDGTLVLVDALSDIPKTFRIDVFGTKRTSSHEISDNFGMFRRMLWQFAEMIRTGRPTIPVQQTLDAIAILISGRTAVREQKTVELRRL